MWSLFNRGKQHNKHTVTRSGEHLVSVASLDFFGSFSESKNCRFLIAWSDFDPNSGLGGFREKGLGTYLLAEDNYVVYTGKMERPNDGKVSDNGTFVLNDWMFGEGPKGTFWAFDKNGNSLVRHRFAANLYNNGMSIDGEYAVCQLCNSDNEDGSTLVLFNLRERNLLWQKVPETGWADSYEFDVSDHRLILRYHDLGEFAYRLCDGVLLDQTKWEKVAFERASCFELHARAKDMLSNTKKTQDLSECDAILELLNIALQRGVEKYPNEQAAIYRTMGETKELLGRFSEALSNYEKALALNPKLGLKRKIVSMKNIQA